MTARLRCDRSRVPWRWYAQGTRSFARLFAKIDGEEWSWCQSRWDRIAWKKSLAYAAVDGVVPEGTLVSLQKASQSLLDWLERLESHLTLTVTRRLKGCTARRNDPGEGSTYRQVWRLLHHERALEEDVAA